MKPKMRILLIGYILFMFMLGLYIVNNEAEKIVQAPTYVRVTNTVTKIKIVQAQSPISAQLLGTFKITHYTVDKRCTPNLRGITANGSHVTRNLTIAVDPEIIPLGSVLYIEGIGIRVAQDTGSAIKGNIIDVYVSKYNLARDLGVKHLKVYLVNTQK